MNKSGKILFSIFILFILSALGAAWFTLEKKRGDKKLELVDMRIPWAYDYGSIQDITLESDLIAVIKVNELIETQITGESGYKTPYSIYDVEVLTPIFNTESGSHFSIRMSGGEMDGKLYAAGGTAGDPLMVTGEKFLVFCSLGSEGCYQTLSYQGRLRLEDGRLYALNLTEKPVPEEEEGTAPDINVWDRDVDEVISQIKSYLPAE